MKHQPRKRFGQNFLHDTHVIDRILDAVGPARDDALLEVGPGMGALTLPLLERIDTLQVVEIDRDLIARLNAMNLSGLTIHESDVLKVNWCELADGKPLRIVGNLPYNIGTPLLLNLLEQREHIVDVHVMLQKEVVDRLCASVGTRAYGRLSVMMQSCFHMQPLFNVPPGAFSPPPKVQSAVVRLQPKPDSLDATQVQKLSVATRMAFANKRKTLRNNFKNTIPEEQLRDAGLDPQVRAETLMLKDFLLLAEMLP